MPEPRTREVQAECVNKRLTSVGGSSQDDRSPGTGLLITDAELRLVHAPRGASSWLAFPLRALAASLGGRCWARAVQPA